MDVNTLYRKAKNGDQKALQELQRLNTNIVNKISRRIKTMKSHGVMSTPATEALFGHLGKETLSKSKKLSLEELRKQIIYGERFTGQVTSTYKGYIAYEKKNIENLKKLGINLTSEEFAGKWSDFMASDYFQELKKFDSTRALLDAEEAVKMGLTLKDEKDAWEDYISDRKTFFEALRDKFPD